MARTKKTARTVPRKEAAQPESKESETKKRTKPAGSGRPKSNLTASEKLAKKRDDYERAKKKREEEKRRKIERGETVKELPEALKQYQFKKVYTKTGESASGVGKYRVASKQAQNEMKQKKRPVVSKAEFDKLLKAHMDFQIKNKDFFNEKASALGALPLYKTPEDDTVANYQAIPYCGLDNRGVFYYPHVKIQYDDDGKAIKSKKVSCRKKTVRERDETGTYKGSKDSTKITGRNKKTVKFILRGLGAGSDKSKEGYSLEELAGELEFSKSSPPSARQISQISLPQLRRVIVQFWDVPKEAAKELTKSEIAQAMVEGWNNRRKDIEIVLKEVPEKKSTKSSAKSTKSSQSTKIASKESSKESSTSKKRSRTPSGEYKSKKYPRPQDIPPDEFNSRFLRKIIESNVSNPPSEEQMNRLRGATLRKIYSEYFPSTKDVESMSPGAIVRAIRSQWKNRIGEKKTKKRKTQ